MERTLVLLKPDAVQRGLIGELVSRTERKGLKITAMKLMVLDDALARRHYAEHVNKSFFGDLIEFITSGPLVTPTLLIMNHGGRGYEDTAASSRPISAYDKDTGEHLGSVDLPAPPGGNPVTYLHEGKQYLVVAVGRGGTNAELLALTLP